MEVGTKTGKQIILKECDIAVRGGEDMTQSKFLEWLNSNFKKESGRQFTPMDVYGYIKRGNLPIKMGRYRISEYQHKETGLKLITVINLDK